MEDHTKGILYYFIYILRYINIYNIYIYIYVYNLYYQA